MIERPLSPLPSVTKALGPAQTVEQEGSAPQLPPPVLMGKEWWTETARRLLWVYLILLLCEGALKKWVIPFALVNLVRDPLVLAIYACAYQAGISFRNRWLLFLFVAGAAVSALQYDYITQFPVVYVYGLRTYFLHLPLIFLLPALWRRREVEQVGTFLMVAALPMALLMVAQYSVPESHWLNGNVENELLRDSDVEFHVRPSGTFTFITGSVSFFQFVAAFAFDRVLTGSKSRLVQGGVGLVALLIAGAVSMSRTFVILTAVMTAIALGIAIMSRRTRQRALLVLLALGLGGFLVTTVGKFSGGIENLQTRFEQASENEGGTSGIIDSRIIRAFLPGKPILEMPVGGWGLGLGSNFAGQMILGAPTFILAEEEWPRVILEAGIIFGLFFLLWRAALILLLLVRAGSRISSGITLPFLLTSAVTPLMVKGVFSVPVLLGFAVFFSGLVLAAMKDDRVNDDRGSPSR